MKLAKLLAVVLVGQGMIALSALAAPNPRDALSNPFFAMDTGTRGAAHKTPGAKVEMLEKLGYAGIGYTGVKGIPEMLEALDARGLEMFTIYTYLRAAGGEARYDPGLKDAMTALAGRDTIIWLHVTGKKSQQGASEADAPIVAAIGEIAEMAARARLRIALYPHANNYVETVGEAVRLVKKVDRPNVGLTFNLCHWLKVEGPENLESVLDTAFPHLFVVSINGADTDGQDWSRLIQPLDRGSFDVAVVLRLLRARGYTGPIGLQHYGIPGDDRANLERSMRGWHLLAQRLSGRSCELLPAARSLDLWRRPRGEWLSVGEVGLDPGDAKRLAWKSGEGVVVNGPSGRTSNLVSTEEFGDVDAHVEFMISSRSNSGVYLMGRYEIQIYDSHGVVKDKYPGLECGGIYPRWVEKREVEGRTPRVNASRPPGEWQSFDVIFRAPRFDETGKKIQNARFVKVLHNGVLVHENVELSGPTRGAMREDEQPTGPLMLQGYHDPVAYRNVRLTELKE